MKFKKFINIWDDGISKITLKDREGLHEFEYPWYFVIRASDYSGGGIANQIKKISYVQKVDVGSRWVKIYTPYYKDLNPVVKYVKDGLGFQTYEADLKLWQRYLVDEDIELELNQRILYFDIETDDRNPGINPGAEQILSIAAIGSDGKEYMIFEPHDERKLLKKFNKLIDRYDLLAGWNSEGFDLVAIEKRCSLFHIPFGSWTSRWSEKDLGGQHNVRKMGEFRARPQTFNHMDMMMKMKEMHYRDTELIKKVRSFSLNAVSEVILGEKKIDRQKKGIYWLAHHDPDLLKKYNMQDVRLLVKLEDKLHIIQQKLVEHHVCNARVNDYTSSGKIDPYALRAARIMGQHLPTRPDYGKPRVTSDRFKKINPKVQEDAQRGVKDEPDYIGGFVFEPVKGIHKNVYIFDFQSLYPSIIKTFNVSLDSFRGTLLERKRKDFLVLPIEDKSKAALFSSKQKGIIPSIIQTILDERNKIRFEQMPKVKKDSPEYWNLHYRQYSFKVLANSMYGIMGASFSRYFKRELAEGITLTGQYLIKKMWKWMVKQGYEPIYGDSDSLFVKIEGEVDLEKLGARMKVFLNKDLEQYGVKKSHLQMDFEKRFDRFILVAKKKYIGSIDGKLEKITGLEMKKRDTLPIAEQLQKEVLTMLLSRQGKVKDEIIALIKKLKKRTYNMKLSKVDLTYQKRLSREVEGYGKTMKDKYGRPKLNKDGKERKVPIPAYVKVAMELKARIEKTTKPGEERENIYTAGNYIPYIITESKDGLKAIYAEDFSGEYDTEYYWEAIFGPTKRILEVVYKKTDWDLI